MRCLLSIPVDDIEFHLLEHDSLEQNSLKHNPKKLKMHRFATPEPTLETELKPLLEPVLRSVLEPILEPILESILKSCGDPPLMVQNCQVGPNSFLESVEYGPRNECMPNADFVQMRYLGDQSR